MKLIWYVQNIRYNYFRKKYDIHPSFRFNGRDIHFYGEGVIEIDENSYIGSLSTIQAHQACVVKIGKGCSISHNVRIYTSSKIPDFDFSDKKNAPEKKGNVIIGDYAWIGANVFINPGVVIGENSVIGANSVVTKNIEPFGIYGGVPAKLIRMKKLDA
jgi:maltose O-acetyltransferase